jgi:prolyl-tRNA synthetase
MRSSKSTHVSAGPGDNILESSKSIIRNDAGIFTYNDIAHRILQRIETLLIHTFKSPVSSVRQNIQQITLPILQSQVLWQKSGRGEGYGNETFVVKTKSDTYFMAPTAEEAACELIRHTVQGYRTLPLVVVQSGSKFRNELRARGDLLRAREFVMNDAYSFCATPAQQDDMYLWFANVYIEFFNKLQLPFLVTPTQERGEIGGDMSHEFLVLCSDGDRKLNVAPPQYTKVHAVSQLNVQRANSSETYTYVECGEIFQLGNLYSKKMNITVQSFTNEKEHPYMGCYGVGLSRTLAVLLDNVQDHKPLSWYVAPFFIYMMGRPEQCDDVYQILCDTFDAENIMFNDSKTPLQDKIKLAKQLGLPLQIVCDSDSITVWYNNTSVLYDDIHQALLFLKEIWNTCTYINYMSLIK